MDITSIATAFLVIRRFRFVAENEWINKRLILVNDDTPIAASVPHITPKKAKARFARLYRALALGGFVENIEEFERRMIVSRSPDEPTRLNIFLPPDIANPLYQVGIKGEFYLQYPEDLVQ